MNVLISCGTIYDYNVYKHVAPRLAKKSSYEIGRYKSNN